MWPLLLPILKGIMYASTAAAAVKSATQKPMENKMVATGEAQGGTPQDSAESIFSKGQPTSQSPSISPLNLQQPQIADQTAALANLGPTGGAPTPQSMGDIQIADQSAALAQTKPPGGVSEGMDLGGFLAGLDNVSGALGSVGKLLAMGSPDQQRIVTAGAAGGGAGTGAQSPFALPQRNTLAQILASLPRTYNG